MRMIPSEISRNRQEILGEPREPTVRRIIDTFDA